MMAGKTNTGATFRGAAGVTTSKAILETKKG